MPQPTLAPRRSAAIRVAVVEDDAACRQSLVQALQTAPDMQLAWQAAARAPALALLPTEALDVLLVDLGLPDGSGLEVIAAARQQWPDCAVMVSTIFGDETHVLRSGGRVQRSVLAPNVRVNSYSQVYDSILMEGVNVGRYAKIKKAIIDKDINIPPGTVIGYDLEADRKRFDVTESGIVVVAKGTEIQ